MSRPLSDVIADFEEMWAKIPMCHKCAVGGRHPWHDDGTLNTGDLAEWVGHNGGPTMEGNGYMEDNDVQEPVRRSEGQDQTHDDDEGRAEGVRPA